MCHLTLSSGVDMQALSISVTEKNLGWQRNGCGHRGWTYDPRGPFLKNLSECKGLILWTKTKLLSIIGLIGPSLEIGEIHAPKRQI
jgi:hypothetical protein